MKIKTIETVDANNTTRVCPILTAGMISKFDCVVICIGKLCPMYGISCKKEQNEIDYTQFNN